MIIKTKFNIGQECYFVRFKDQLKPFNIKIGCIDYNSNRRNKIFYDSDLDCDDGYFDKYVCMKEHELFETKEEAQAKLKELQGES